MVETTESAANLNQVEIEAECEPLVPKEQHVAIDDADSICHPDSKISHLEWNRSDLPTQFSNLSDDQLTNPLFQRALTVLFKSQDLVKPP
jgi:hypothetical protein